MATIGLQIFWNIKNYKENKSQLIKEVQTAFDNSIEYYYVEDSKNDFVAFVDEYEAIPKDDFVQELINDSIFKNNFSRIKNQNSEENRAIKKDKLPPKIDSSMFSLSVSYTATAHELNEADIPKKILDSIKWKLPKNQLDSLKPQTNVEIHGDANNISAVKVYKGKRATDSIAKLTNLVNKIIFSTFQDSLDFKKLSKSVERELARKNIEVDYSLQHFKSDTIFDQFEKNQNRSLPLTAVSGTTFLPKEQKLQISFSDPTILILQRSFTEIILSLLLSLSIVFCLLYLLRTINKQKKIDLIKNDLISNITHEFKTPITTISTAIEGIKNFNALDDKEKTRRYLDISGQQLKKLEIMVEKLLETASLDSNKLNLNKETINIIPVLKALVERHLMASDKILQFVSNQIEITCSVDVFHFENAVSNLIDNAIKYGGTQITLEVSQTKNLLIIAVKDNGTGIDNTQREKIFDQFYRIPKGNIHDVKGFGIGLFYAKKIIEKHGGKLELIPHATQTIFQITLNDVK